MKQEARNEMATLSKLLRVTMLDAEAFGKAVEQGLIEVRADGTLCWMLENNTLLAYFCGRLWCGDKGAYSRRKKAVLWQMGERGAFPSVALEKLFGVNSLKQSRLRRRNRVLPEHFEVVDHLFNSQFTIHNS